MLVQLVKHNDVGEMIEVLDSGLAVEMAESLDRESERCCFEQCEVLGEECYPPSLAFTNDCSRTFEFGPSACETFWIHYRYPALRSHFGFTALEQEVEQLLPSTILTVVMDCLRSHYRGEHQTLLRRLPQETPFFEDLQNRSED